MNNINEYFSRKTFNVDEYIDFKVKAINHFFTTENLDAIVLGVSGGIDSSVVAALLNLAATQENSPIKKILCLSLPIMTNGVSGQEDAKNFAELSCSNLKKVNFIIQDLTAAAEAYQVIRKAWPNGQLASIVRTPALYYHAAILQDVLSLKSIVCGTTNLSEGGLIGFFGKASDAMVDFQPIIDIYKSEVYEVAKKLNVPEEIIARTPRGDVWDGATDIEMIGAPYDVLEYYMAIENANISIEEKEAILKIAKKNKHKYEVGLPSKFVNYKDIEIKNGLKLKKYLIA